MLLFNIQLTIKPLVQEDEHYQSVYKNKLVLKLVLSKTSMIYATLGRH